ncbi:facilitated trehalose transporter Tret1-like [Harmonia axyridis]|uniref:facilitated trehalose transporter Tret1-like n=1 Tax=Harmonia axyridis TaxID=115357 RepID=UPI001E277391|nr:facilitated trehalose transporter Tret1-like [Harmonia axyridis]
MEEHNNGLRYMFAGTYPQILAVLSCTTSAISDGMSYGWSAPIIPKLEAPDSPIKITENDKDNLENVYLLGAIFGVPVTVFLVDKIGRKYTILMAGLINLAAWLIIAIANTAPWILVARFMVGTAGDVAFIAAPMYIAEIADQKIRGFLSSLIFTMMLIGILLMYVIGPYVAIQTSSLVAAFFLAVQILTFSFMPESPYFYLCKGKYGSAKRSLERLRADPNVEKEITEMKTAIERQKSESGRFKDLFVGINNRKALTIMIVLNGAQHFSAYSVIMMNMHMILGAASSTYLHTNYTAMIFALFMMIAAFLAGLVCDKFGRKILLTISSFLTSIVLVILAIFLHLKQVGYNVDGISWIPIVCVLAYALVFKVGLGLLPIVLTAELFSANVKAMGMCLADAFYIAWAMLSVYVFFWSSRSVGMYFSFYIFAACAFLTSIYCMLAVPETKGKTLEQIQMMLKGVKPPKIVEMKEIKSKDQTKTSPESVAFLSQA